MEDVGIPIQNEPLVVKPNSSEIRTREEINSEESNGHEKRQKIEQESPTQVGLLDNLLAKLSSPRVTSNPGDDLHGSDDVGPNDGNADADGAGVGGGGGVIDKISSFFSRGGEDEDKDEGENGKDDGGESRKENDIEVLNKESEEGSSNNGASVISSLIPDGVAPASDEASILIHSVVHD